MIVKDPVIFRDLFTSFEIPTAEIPNAVMVDGKRHELMIVYDSDPQRFAIKGAHNLTGKEIQPCI